MTVTEVLQMEKQVPEAISSQAAAISGVQVQELGSNQQIIGVVVKELVSHGDQRGFFREILRHTDPIFDGGIFGQWSHSLMQRDVVKAWHFHHVQTDWWYVPLGCVETVLFDNRPESPTYQTKMILYMGSPNESASGATITTKPLLVRIPPGVLHGCRVLSEEAHLFYITSHTYDPQEEGRLPFNSPVVDHYWGESPITVENDRRTHIPAAARTPIR